MSDKLVEPSTELNFYQVNDKFNNFFRVKICDDSWVSRRGLEKGKSKDPRGIYWRSYNISDVVMNVNIWERFDS